MALRTHQLGQDIKELILRLPWWAGLLCALVSYLLLRPLAAQRAGAPGESLGTAFSAFAQLAAGLAAVAQYLLPLAFLALAAVSAFLQWKRQDLRASLAFDPAGAGLRSLSREDATFLVAAAFRSRGFLVRDAEEVALRNGFDLQLERGDERLLLQVRNWKSAVLDAPPLTSLFVALQRFRADRAMVLISGRFTAEALAFVADKPIDLIDGRRLKELITTPQPSPLATLADALRAWLAGRPRGAAPPTPGGDGSRAPPGGTGGVDAADEQALGEALTALIRGESRSPETAVRIAPGIPGSEPPTSEPAPGTAGVVSRGRARAPISARRVANLIGMTLALGLGWVTYEWFDTLPASPSDTPWALLGRHNPAPAQGHAELAAGIVSGEKTLPPLGQLDYGPDPAMLLANRWGLGLAHSGGAGIGGFRSIRELEDAFNDRYVPPPSCFEAGSPGGLTSCGNHRIRARRAFIASNGRTMTPEPSAPPADTGWFPAEPDEARGWWWGADAERSAIDDAGDHAADDDPGWPAEPSRAPGSPPMYVERWSAGPPRGDPTWGGATLDMNRPQEPFGPDWGAWSQPGRGGELATGGWRTGPDGSDWPDGGGSEGPWRRGAFSDAYPGSAPPGSWDPVPRVRRLPVDQWLPTDRPPVTTWRDEQWARDQRTPDDARGWSQGSADGAPDRASPQPDGAVTEPAPDWREDWLRRD
jgi:restriction system protein